MERNTRNTYIIYIIIEDVELIMYRLIICRLILFFINIFDDFSILFWNIHFLYSDVARRKYIALCDSLTKIGNNVAIFLGDERL